MVIKGFFVGKPNYVVANIKSANNKKVTTPPWFTVFASLFPSHPFPAFDAAQIGEKRITSSTLIRVA
jgi:hypothetical protein